MKRGDRVGRWTLDQYIDEGGNGTVWRAFDGGAQAAIKILHKARGERLDRFRREIEFMRRRIVPEVLPVLDYSLDLPHCWFAMPLATPIEEALGRTGARDLVEVVRLMAELAGVVARLHQKGFFHRDLKHQNMLIHEGSPVLSDFGLVCGPGDPAITSAGRLLGPKYYLPPEVLRLEETMDWAAVDVYSFAKSIWVLATGQRYPFPGEMSLVGYLQVGSYNAHEKAALLDAVLAPCMRTGPRERPSMQRVASELEAWLSVSAPASLGVVPDLASVAAWSRALLPVIRQEPNALQRRREAIERLADLAIPELQRSVDEVRRQCPDLDVSIGLGGWVAEQLATRESAASRGAWLVATCEVPRKVVGQPTRIQFVSGIGFNTYIDGTTTVGAMQYYHGDRSLRESVVWTTGEEPVDPTLPSCEVRMQALLRELQDRLPAGLSSYLTVLSTFNRPTTEEDNGR